MSDGDCILIPETVVPGMRLGRHVDHDPRNRDYPAVTAKTPDLPLATKVWARHGVFNQGDIGACTGFALTGVAATAPFNRGMSYTHTAAITIYEQATRLDNIDGAYKPDDTGSTGLAACKAAVAHGFAKGYKWGFGVGDLVRIVATIGPAAVGTNWHEDMDEPDRDGFVRPTGPVRGGHEYEVIGYHHQIRPYFELVNSWGPTWPTPKLDGRFFMFVDDMTQLLKEGGDCVTLVT